MLSRSDYEKLPAKRMGSCALIFKGGKALLVEPTYKDTFEIPGGIVENDESPRDALKREIKEELGIDAEPGRLLVVDYQSGDEAKTESLMFVFEIFLNDESKIELPEAELRSWCYAEPETWEKKLSPPLARRLKLAVNAMASNTTFYVENGLRY
jgi:8-oxo-dGTP diphosphatase